MLSRQDDENPLVMFSDNPHHWSDPNLILRPTEASKSVTTGSCASLIHDNQLILPYAMRDKATAIVSLPLIDLLSQLAAA